MNTLDNSLIVGRNNIAHTDSAPSPLPCSCLGCVPLVLRSVDDITPHAEGCRRKSTAAWDGWQMPKIKGEEKQKERGRLKMRCWGLLEGIKMAQKIIRILVALAAALAAAWGQRR